MIGFLGGTGPEGRGLALRFALAGQDVMLGSRDSSRAVAAAEELTPLLPDGISITGAENLEVATKAEIVFVTVPYNAHQQTLSSLTEAISNKILVDVVAPLVFDRGKAKAITVPEGSAARQAQSLLPSSRVVAAFHNISAEDLLIPDREVNCDVIVCSDDEGAKSDIMNLAQLIPGVRGVNGNGLDCARYVEELTALLLNINRIHKSRSMIKIVGV